MVASSVARLESSVASFVIAVAPLESTAAWDGSTETLVRGSR